ncbi:hypothetical protein CLOM_g9943 [Closterium sp. NIES-68]|nr:hypothetical protein CLOM_g9943 [Closterium sp. NIES-68]GJP68459.1 hypothetical protein CLOP_g25165 [Closterium sp. NIES-67]
MARDASGDTVSSAGPSLGSKPATASHKRIATYTEFWPFYLKEHSKPATRLWHTAGTLAAVACVTSSAVTRNPRFLLLAPVVGYGCAWYSHFFVQRNKPATFRYPLWSLYSDFRMAFLIVTGRLSCC